jgi:hypothetical protein
VGKEPNHTTAKKAWPSINHSILSGHLCWHEVSCRTDRPSSRVGQCAGSTDPRARSLQPGVNKIINHTRAEILLNIYIYIFSGAHLTV